MARRDETSLGGLSPAFPATSSRFLEGLHDLSAPEGRASLEELCRRYWKPVYCFVRLFGSSSNEDAKDLTQGFFTWLLGGDVLARYERGRAPFRQYLKGVLRRYLSDARERAGRIKRGGGATFIPIDGDGPALEDLCEDPAGDGPDDAFDRAWLVALIDHAVERLRATLRPEPFRVFQEIDLAAGPDRPTYAEVAARLGLTEEQVKRSLAAARRALREEMEAEVRRHTQGPEDFEEEWNALRRL
jgi:RNA polymerase sigma-70 factor (ECF subfamily)